MLANKKFNIKILNFLVMIKVIGILFLIPITFFYGTFQILNKYWETVYFLFYDSSLYIYVPYNNESAKINKMIIVFRQLILEEYGSITLKLTNRQISDVVLEIIGILSVIMRSKLSFTMLAYQYNLNPDLFINQYADFYCIEFKTVRESMSDRFTPTTVEYAKDFIKKIIDYSSAHPDSKATEYIKFTKIKKW